MKAPSISQSFYEADTPLLVIQPLVGIGDMIWHKPWIDQLIADNDVYLATKLASQPHILFHDKLAPSQIIEIDRNTRGRKGRHDGLGGLFRMARAFRQTGAKRALLLHHSQSYRLALAMAGIRHVAAFGFGKDKGLACKALKADDKKTHAITRMQRFWHINNWPMPQDGWHITVEDARKQACITTLTADGITPDKLLILGIGAMHEDRCWPASRFAELISHLRQERPSLAVAIMGGPQERIIADKIQDALQQAGDAPVYEIFGSLEDAIAMLSVAAGYVGNDTSLLNIAAVLGVPSLGLFSQSPPLTYVPTLHHLDVIKDEEYGTPGIIAQIETDDVLAGIEAIWPEDA